ncbi:hypothetical protein ACPXB3_09410 [Gordonia sp. DT219]|uniref:hypothetical protein n=1 Tax=Gordonia sp. DT219 TaxID=3416658 RepID=UPI003CE828B6
MTLTIGQVEDFSIGSLTQTGDGLSSGAESLAGNATSVLNELDRASTDWKGETQTQVAVKAKDHAESLRERADRWSNAAVVLRTAADQLGKLRDEILATVDDMMVRTVCDVADSGVATVRKSYLQKLAAANVNDQDGLADAREKAFAFATQITFKPLLIRSIRGYPRHPLPRREQSPTRTGTGRGPTTTAPTIPTLRRRRICRGFGRLPKLVRQMLRRACPSRRACSCISSETVGTNIDSM